MDSASAQPKAFKDRFDRHSALALAEQIARVLPSFDQGNFVSLATRGLAKLELNGRAKQFTIALTETLPKSKVKAIAILTKSLPEALPDCESTSDGWRQWPIGSFIAEHGLDHFEESMLAMQELTQRFTSEFAVRPFVEEHQERTLERLLQWTDHPSPHVRRWCSEGVRPRLPWGRKLRALVKDPTPILPILEALKDDPELYVRRSVANNLNDIAKDHPDLVVRIAKRWSKQASSERKWVVKHGLRTLLKDGHPQALACMGFAPAKQVTAELQLRPKRIAIGSDLHFTAKLKNDSQRSQKLLLDYAIHFVRQGNKTSAKVFKWKALELPAHSDISLQKRHPIRLTTIRALYPGTHRVELQVNGVRMSEAIFQLR